MAAERSGLATGADGPARNKVGRRSRVAPAGRDTARHAAGAAPARTKKCENYPGRLIVFRDDGFGVSAFGAGEGADLVSRPIRLDARQPHLGAALAAGRSRVR